MVRIKTNGEFRDKKKSSDSAPKRGRVVVGRAGRMLVQRAKVIVVLLVVALLGWGMQGVWHHYSPQISKRGNYLLVEERITATPTPEWISSDVCAEAVRDAALAGRLSVLDDAFVQVVDDAFLLHPWVESVDQITRRYPAGVHVDLTYRRPVAVVELVHQQVVQLIPVDRHGVHLPASDVPNIRRRYLPRIGGIVERPPAGQSWTDQRVLGATKLVVELAPAWEELHLENILPSARPEIRGDQRYFVYDLITRGGTRVVWGAAPGASPPGEEKFADKLARLRSCATTYGALDSENGPEVIDVRQQKIDVIRRTAKKVERTERTAEKPNRGSEEPIVKQAAKRKAVAK